MKRFKNILAHYDLAFGSDDTLERAIELCRRNEADLTVLSVVPAHGDSARQKAERERILSRVAAGIDLPAERFTCEVRQGVPAEEILREAQGINCDLIMIPDQPGETYSQFFAVDTVSELMRRADCPVWVIRPPKGGSFRRIVAAVNAGKAGALDCPANRRILEIASSLARLERSSLDVVYAWEFTGKEKDRVESELPRGRYDELIEDGRLRNLSDLCGVIEKVLGSTSDLLPVAVRGHPDRAVIDYLEQHDADLLIVDGKIGSPILSALVTTQSMRLMRGASCSVLFTRANAAADSLNIRAAA